MNFNIRNSPIFYGIAIESKIYKCLLYINNDGCGYNSIIMSKLIILGVDILV